MPEANSAPFFSNPKSRYPRIAPEFPRKLKLLAHSDVKKTMIYTHVLNRCPAGVRSPVGGLRNGTRGFYADPHKTPR